MENMLKELMKVEAEELKFQKDLEEARALMNEIQKDQEKLIEEWVKRLAR